jgi:hypothetical protein
MARNTAMDYPDIVPSLVFPFEGTCTEGERRVPALVFARQGRVVLFADERQRRFGVGLLDVSGDITGTERHATLDLAAIDFLSRAPRRRRAPG